MCKMRKRKYRVRHNGLYGRLCVLPIRLSALWERGKRIPYVSLRDYRNYYGITKIKQMKELLKQMKENPFEILQGVIFLMVLSILFYLSIWIF